MFHWCRRAMCRQVYSRARRRTASRRETHFVASDIFLGSGNNRTGLGQDCRCTGYDQVDVDVRINRCACTLRGHNYKLRAVIDTKWMRKQTRKRKKVREKERENYEKGEGRWGAKVDK